MRKNKIVFILVICLFTLICGCSKEKVNSDNGNSTHIVSKLKNQGDMTEDKKETKNIVLDIPSTADFLYSCNTIKELKEHADLILKATVKEEHAWVDGVATIGTEYVLEINKCYIGKAQNTIIVNNLGGTILASKYLEKQNDPKMDELKKKVVNPLTGKKIGAYYGCLLLRPGKIMAFDNPENPTIIEDFIRAIGAEPVVYPYRNECCGGYISLKEKDMSKNMCNNIMDSAAGFGAEMLITACPLCLYNLNKSGNGKLPVHYFTELLAEALGVKEEALQTLTSDKEVAE